MHTVSYNILASEIGSKYHGSMGSVQDADFSLLIRFVVVCDQNRKTGLGKGQLFS